MTFEDLRLDEPLIRAVSAAGYQSPTPIQSKAIPVVLDGQDVLGTAQTGTGKTAAFALPILQRLMKSQPAKRADESESDPAPVRNRQGRRPSERGPQRPIRAVVLCPTRELAQQIDESFTTYGRHTRLRTATIFGGVNQNPQVRALRAGVDIIVATPGRMLDLMNQGHIDLKLVEVLVLDEADHMLDMGFIPDIRRILAQMPKKRQSLLFSATMPPVIRKLANDMLRDPVAIQVARVSEPAESVSHQVYHVERTQKTPLLVHLLNNAPGTRSLVFTRTKRGAETLARRLTKSGLEAAAIHGNKSQAARNRALDAFRSFRTPVLVATDLAARGIDVADIGHVFNYDLTPDPETYVHRIGRTGRAGASGAAVSFCTRDERGDLRAIEKLIKKPLRQTELPEEIPEAAPSSGGESGRQRSRTSASPTRSRPGPSRTKPRPSRSTSRNSRSNSTSSDERTSKASRKKKVSIRKLNTEE